MKLRLALRSVLRAPGFASFSVLVMALGIGLTTVAFFVLNAVLLQPLDLPSPYRLVRIHPVFKKSGRLVASVPGLDFRDLRDRAEAFSAMAAYWSGKTTILVGGRAEQVQYAVVSPGWHETLGVQPMIGRGLFSNGTDETSVLISHAFWQSRMGGDPNVLKRSIQAQGRVYGICGVMPGVGVFPEKAAVWAPMIPENDGADRSAFNYRVIGRLRPGISADQGKASLSVVAAALEKQYRGNKDRGYTLVDLREELVGGYRAMLLTLGGAVLVVLLIACANVMNLMLARALGRQRELSIRMALGARARHLFGVVLAESLLICGLGGAAGLLLAMWARDLLVTLNPFPIPRLASASLDVTVMGFALLASVLCGVVTGLLPAWRVWRSDVRESLAHASSRSTTAGGERLRSGLLVAEVAFSVLLLVGAGLLLRSFARLSSVNPGFSIENLLVMEVDLTALGRDSGPRVAAFYEQVRQRALTLPKVIAAGWNRDIPTHETNQNGYVDIEGRAPAPPGEQRRTSPTWHVVGPGFFHTLGVPVRLGREFTLRDERSAPDVAVVNEAFANELFPGENPIGRRFRIGLDRSSPITIVGVVGNMRQLAKTAGPELFLPYLQHLGSSGQLYLTVRTQGATAPLIDALRKEAASMPEAVVRFTSMKEAVSETAAGARFRTVTLVMFAGISLALTLAGLYGVISYIIAARSREIGLRMALGARIADVLGQFLSRGLRLTGFGLLIGLTAAFVLRKVVAAFLFEIPPSDWLSYLGTAAVLVGGSLLACLVPAWRASRTDPAVVLRDE
jgi:putative ABC transport system permease protein